MFGLIQSRNLGDAPAQSLAYTFDAAGDLKTANDNVDTTRNQAFNCDALDRLTQASGVYGTYTYGYDADNNRAALSLTSPGGSFSQSYAYATGSNQLQSVTQGTIVRSISYTADGNTLQDNFGTGAVFSYGYNNDNRMVQVSLGGATQASYTLNYLGQRVSKSAVGTGTTHFHYDRGGHLIAESDGAGNVLREYVFLGDTPVAFITALGIDFIHADHLGTPQKMTDASQSVVWDGGASDPFMMSALPLTPAMGLRLPGQYFDGETGLHYNYFRDYDPSLGRYIESDPIGLGGGINTYAYVGGNPVALNDPSGRNPVLLGAMIGGGGDLLYQLYRNGGRFDCINWGEAGGAAFTGALFGLGGEIVGEALGELIAAEAIEGAGADAALAAEEAGTALSDMRLTQEGESYLRYESGNPAFSRVTPDGGLQPGTFAAPASEGAQSQSLLNDLYNLPNPEIPRTTYFEINPPAGTPVIGPRPVSGGTGSEVTFPFGVGPGSAGPAVPTPP